jgi:hypothetical protein
MTLRNIMVYNMDPSAANSVQHRDVEQLRGFVDQMTVQVATCHNIFDHQEELVDALDGDASASCFAVAQARADKLEDRFVAAKARQDVAYNMYAVTMESTNTTFVVFAKSASKGSEETTKTTDGKFLKRELKEPNEWKDS